MLKSIDMKKGAMLFALLALMLAFTGMAVASTTGAEFQGLYNTLVGWTDGFLGKTIAIFAFVIGLGLGVARSTPIPAISGIVFALFVAYGPGLLDGIVTATI